MEKTIYKFEDFLADVSDEYKDFVIKINELLNNDGYKIKIESKKRPFKNAAMVAFILKSIPIVFRFYFN